MFSWPGRHGQWPLLVGGLLEDSVVLDIGDFGHVVWIRTVRRNSRAPVLCMVYILAMEGFRTRGLY